MGRTFMTDSVMMMHITISTITRAQTAPMAWKCGISIKFTGRLTRAPIMQAKVKVLSFEPGMRNCDDITF